MIRKMIVVDDEYRTLETIRQLLPYQDYGIEVVCTVESGEEALTYLYDQPVDIVLTEISMATMSGLELIAEIHRISPDTHCIVMSSQQEFEYARAAMTLGALGYLVKPIKKADLLRVLQHLPNRSASLDWAREFLEGKIGASEILKEQGALCFSASLIQPTHFLYTARTFLGKRVYFQLTDCEPEGNLLYKEWLKTDSQLAVLMDKVERFLFYQALSEDDSATTAGIYEALSPILQAGQIPLLLVELPAVTQELRQKTPAIYLSKQLFNQLMTDIYHYFHQLDWQQLEDFFLEVEQSRSLEELVGKFKWQLIMIAEKPLLSDHVRAVLEIVRGQYSKELSLKDISAQLYLNTVYLGQLIKKETGQTFAEILNHQRIRAAQQLLWTTSASVEDISCQVGYANMAYFYKIFKRICGVSPKTYREQMTRLYMIH